MTRLLVSVRSAAEAADALAGGADLIDIKEPNAGPLGAAEPRVVAEVVEVVAGRAPVSAALGELADDGADQRAAALPPGVQYAKLGLARCADHDWSGRWRTARENLPASAEPVAVVYADWRIASSPLPGEILSAAREMNVRVLLIDTWSKSRGGLLAIWPWPEVVAFAREVRAAELKLVLAGGLQLDDLDRLEACEPDYFAVRGAVCGDSRQGRLDPARVAAWRARLAVGKPLGAPS